MAAEVADGLDAPLDVIVVRKLGVPGHNELGMGAIGEGGVLLLNDDVLRLSRVTTDQLVRVRAREQAELERRVAAFRGDRPAVSLDGRTAVVVDDGVATGFTARVACAVATARGAARVLLAAPVVLTRRPLEVEVVSLSAPSWLTAVGQAYEDFEQTTDEEVVRLLSTR